MNKRTRSTAVIYTSTQIRFLYKYIYIKKSSALVLQGGCSNRIPANGKYAQ